MKILSVFKERLIIHSNSIVKIDTKNEKCTNVYYNLVFFFNKISLFV